MQQLVEEQKESKCSNCNKILQDLEYMNKSCQNCLESQKKSKLKRSQQQLKENEQFCNRCSCVRLITDFVVDGKQKKTCVKCRERNKKTSIIIKEHNSDHPDQQLCTLCHKPNTNNKQQCDVCLDNKKKNRKRCEHNRIYDQCGEGECIKNASNICKEHRVRNPCARCRNDIYQLTSDF